jgi:branched-chain amino acid transport system substrate-binding protein
MNTRRFAKFAFVLAIVALAVGLSGCEKMKTMMPDDMTQMTGGEVSIGIAVALTGEHAEPYGLPMQRGLDLAKEEINMLGGVNITFVPADTLSTVEGRKAAVQQLVDQGVSAIIGIGISTHLKQAFPIAQAAGVVAFSPISSAAGLSGEIGDYVFRAGIATNILVPGGVTKTHAKLAYKNVAVIYDEIDAYSISVKDELKKALEEKGVNILLEEAFDKEAADYSTQLINNIKNLETQPEALFIAALSKQMTEIIIQARGENGISSDVKLIVPDLTNAEAKNAGAAAEGAIAFAGWSSLTDTPVNQAFVQSYTTKYGFAPEPWAAQAYATLYILADAIAKAQSTDSAAIRDALAKTSHFPTILGAFSFDPNGEAIYEDIETIVLIVKDGIQQDF